MASTTDLLTAALDAASRGWHVFPLRPGAKTPALHGHESCPGAGPCASGHAGWEQRATTDHDRIRAAWSHKPFNIGLATGPSGLLVVDLDVPKPDDKPRPEVWNLPGVNDGLDVFVAVCDQAGQPVPWDTFTVRTPSGGTHFYFTAPDGVELRNTGGSRGRGLGWKVDTRAWGGYVVAPGSVVDGQRYEIVNDAPPLTLPEWLCERLTPPPLPKAPTAPITQLHARRGAFLNAALRGEVDRVTSATSDRNWALYHAACALGQLVAGGALSERLVRATLLAAAAGHIAAGAYSERQAHLTITSGLRAGANRPRRVA